MGIGGKIPSLNEVVLKEYSFSLKNFFNQSNCPWNVSPGEFHPKLFFSPKGMNFDNAFEGIEFVKLSYKRESNFLQVGVYWEGMNKKDIQAFYDRDYEKMKRDKDILILLKPLVFEKDIISELEFISSNFKLRESSKSSLSQYS